MILTDNKVLSRSMADDKQDFRVTQWNEARSVVDNMDKTLSGLRQFGFSFVTALLAASSVLYQTTITPTVKLAVVIATYGLIFALYATDSFYRLIQTSASHKCEMIEIDLGYETGLTHYIGKIYHLAKDWWFIEVLYYVFILAAMGLGLAVLPLYGLHWIVVILVAAVFVGAIRFLDSRSGRIEETMREEVNNKRKPAPATGAAGGSGPEEA